LLLIDATVVLKFNVIPTALFISSQEYQKVVGIKRGAHYLTRLDFLSTGFYMGLQEMLTREKIDFAEPIQQNRLLI
jgi:hypothetical protein